VALSYLPFEGVVRNGGTGVGTRFLGSYWLTLRKCESKEEF
jgi:hypothetical protein